MKRWHKKSISLIMTAVYLLITLSPLASAGSGLNQLLRAMNGKCSDDCRTCGCSTERSASHTCCCWQKKLARAKTPKQPGEHKPCPTASKASGTKAAASCCKKSAQHHDHEDVATISAQADTPPDADSVTVTISTCPCGSGKDLTFFNGERSQHLPCRFLSGIPQRKSTQLDFLQPERLASQYGEPPDPPPKLSVIS